MNSLTKLLVVACLSITQGCALLPYIQEALDSVDNATNVTNEVAELGPVPAWDKATKSFLLDWR